VGAIFLAGVQKGAMDPQIVLFGAPMVGLLLIRQFLAFQDLKRFSYGLETKVAERTRALEAAQSVAMRTERMNALATLGAGLAHDLNNSLATIRASAELLAEDVHAGKPPTDRDVDRILVASDQAAGLSRRLMGFGRDEPHGLLDLSQEIHAMEDLLRMLLPRRIRLRIALGQGAFPVSGTRSNLEQILVNLVSNSRDAITGEGAISIELHRVEGSSGAEALVRVEDTGCGIPEHVMARLFEPFLSTKEKGKGTGLGLCSVKVLVEQDQGRIEVASNPNLGTVFTIRFPLAV
jgi:signal transduction histidine kinase